MTVYDESIIDDDLLDAYHVPISGPIGQLSFFRHQVAHYDSCYTRDVTDRVGELTAIPHRIIWGAAEAWQPVDYAHRLTDDIPGADRHVIADAGHFCMEDQPDTVAQFVGQPRDDG